VHDDPGVREREALAAVSRTCAIDAAKPIATVCTSHGTRRMVSKTANPADTDPPGELM
jgi:hypothetical protein